jgi:alkylhydroperoxidase family enzyme
MARISYVEPASAPEAVREVLERLPAQLNIFKLMAHAETGFRPLLRLGTSILGQQKLSSRLRELAILRVAKLEDAEYEWVQHVPIAKATGATDAQVAALEAGRTGADCFDPLERAVLRFTDEVVETATASEPLVKELVERTSERELVELLLAIGFYMTVARLMNVCAIDMEPPAGEAVVRAAAGTPS